MHVAMIGAGPLGRWLALAAARAGYTVLLEDVMPANLHHAQEYIRQQYSPETSQRNVPETTGPELVRSNLPAQGFAPASSSPESERASAPEARSSASPPVHFVSTIEDAVRDADLAIDCVPDELESKLEIFWLLDRMAPPRTVLATPTTRLSIADLASCTYRADRCVVIAMDPRDFSHIADTGSEAALLIKTTERTSPETVKLVREFWTRLGVG